MSKIDSEKIKTFLQEQVKKITADKLFCSFHQAPAYNGQITALNTLLKYIEHLEKTDIT